MADNDDESRVSPQDGQLRASAITVAAFFGVALLIGVAALAYALLDGGGDDGQPGTLTAVIVDQLELTYPNPEFVDEATQTLRDAGYAVDYVPGEEVTVDFYRSLPARDPDILIIRAHSGLVGASENEPEDAFLFSSELYSYTKYAEERQEHRLALAYAFSYAGDDVDEQQEAFRETPRYFGVASGFVESSMNGKFRDTTVILMGCNVLAGERLGRAFVNKGASAVVGWDDLVSADHTDAATLSLLSHMLDENLSPQEAAARAMEDVGPDPTYGAKFLAYPPRG